ncbi:SDR family oxidoreductase [Dermatobacter hominis]|uniref:SDR family oxidoreductase n=1 Tax=Dermatobacter hominis TaxID=2884263 RepID=UPI001D11C39C|nr:SDR family oxidoreductase [Dermatobacter hominis]UDY37615.1 SDR family oxidoreductase [Dermatobacter hominis]
MEVVSFGADAHTPLRHLITGLESTNPLTDSVVEAAAAAGHRLMLASGEQQVHDVRQRFGHLDVVDSVIGVDVTSHLGLSRLFQAVRNTWGAIDGVFHGVWCAPPTAVEGPFAGASGVDVCRAFEVNVYSYAAVARTVSGLASPTGVSMVGLDLSRAYWEQPNWLSVCSAALVQVNTSLSQQLARSGLRSNLVAPIIDAMPGSVRTERRPGTIAPVEPLTWTCQDPGPAADVVLMLLSPTSRSMTGQVVHADPAPTRLLASAGS